MNFLRRLFGGRKESKKVVPEKLETLLEREGVFPRGEETAPLDPSRLDTAPLTRLKTKQLPPLDKYLKSSGRLVYAQATDTGQERDANEDALYVMSSVVDTVEKPPQLGVFVVADGMGGYAGGEQASARAVRMVARRLTDALFLPSLMEKSADTGDTSVIEVMKDALESANTALLEDESSEAGTTLTAAVFQGRLLSVCHAGDSRLYLLHDGEMKRLTNDHTIPGRLEEMGQMEPEEARVHPERHKLYKVLGRKEPLEPDTFTRRLEPGARVLLCSDGLWGEVEDADMQRIIESAANSLAACEKLIEAANEGGGADNITAVLIQLPDEADGGH